LCKVVQGVSKMMIEEVEVEKKGCLKRKYARWGGVD